MVWAKKFEFSKEQVSELRGCFKRLNGFTEQDISDFIDACEKIVMKELSFMELDKNKPKHREMIKIIEKMERDTKKLIKQFDELGSNISLLSDPSFNRQFRGGSIHDLKHDLKFFTELLSVKLPELELIAPESGKTSADRFIIQIYRAYEENIGKPGGVSDETPFVMVMEPLLDLVGVELKCPRDRISNALARKREIENQQKGLWGKN